MIKMEEESTRPGFILTRDYVKKHQHEPEFRAYLLSIGFIEEKPDTVQESGISGTRTLQSESALSGS